MSSKAGYEYLLAYKITVPIYDYTVIFCRRWIAYHSRTKDQMEQAARSGMTNIPEGHKQKSLESYIKLSGVALGSLEELNLDYQSYARQHGMEIWGKEKTEREIGEIREIWGIVRNNPTLPTNPHFPYLPNSPIIATNLLFTLTKQAMYLMQNLISSLEHKHMTEGGFRENLLRTRLDYRNTHH